MMHTEKLRRKPRFFRMFTGLTAEEFEKLLGELEPVWKSILATKSKRTPRRRKPGGGRKVKVPLADRLLVTLLYYRTYVTQEFVGYLFGVDKGTVSRIVEAVGKALTGVFRIPEKKVRVDPEVMKEVFLDATERSVYRPQRKQRRSYSGKKKRHTVKHQVVVARVPKRPGAKQKVRIVAVSKVAKGRVHDKKLYDRSRLRVPRGVGKTGDSAYQGTDVRVPKKKPKKGELTPEEKRSNRELSRRRIVAEHGIGKMKIWRIAAERYRNPVNRHTVMMKNIAGLHNRMYG